MSTSEKQLYTVIEDFIIISKWENKMGQKGTQEFLINKGSVVALPTEAYTKEYDKALKEGKMVKLEIVKAKVLVDVERGNCKGDGQLIKTMVYNPCIHVKKGEIVTGYINNNRFIVMRDNKTIGIYLAPPEYKLINETNNSDAPIKAKDSLFLIETKDFKLNITKEHLIALVLIVGGYFAYKKFSK